MIRYLKHEEIDFAKWDAAIDACQAGMVYAKSWYLNIVSPGWEALIEEEYQIVFPVTWRKKGGINYLHQPFFTQQLGVFSKTTLKENDVERFLSAIPKKFRLIEIQLNQSNHINENDFKISVRKTHHLDLNRPYEIIKKNYSDNLKRNLRRAAQNSLTIKKDFDTKALISLFKTNRGKEVSTLKENDYFTFEKLVEEGRGRKLVTSIGVSNEGRLEAGAIFFKSDHEYIFLFSATGEKAKESGAMTFIIDHFISTHSTSEMKLDFEGSMDSGLSRFYKSFGSDEVVYLQIRKNNLPWMVRWLK